MVETLIKPNIVQHIESFEDRSTPAVRTVVRYDDKGKQMAYAERPIIAETGFKASILAWDRIKGLIEAANRYPAGRPIFWTNYMVVDPSKIPSLANVEELVGAK